ncbi:MAG TPA: tetratricopeptide repeat protein [Phycisphaerae bacterium]|nr:tetratricopeptide repeat protein [Phycisphaerae bacterium]
MGAVAGSIRGGFDAKVANFEYLMRVQREKRSTRKNMPVPRETAGVVAGRGRGPWAVACAMLVVAAVTLLGQWPATRAGAICFDDIEYMVENPLVLRPSAANAGRFLGEVLEPSTVHGYYQPLAMISLMLDVAMGGGPKDLAPFHRTSLLLHATNAAMVVLVLYLLLGHLWAAGILGIFFGLHPMTVETIVWVGERKTVLAALFALPAIVAYVRYVRTQKRGWYVACAVLFVLALMSKPTATPLPVCLLLLDVWPLKRLSRKAILEKIPLLIIALVSAWITYESQKRTAITVLPGRETWWHIPLILSHNIVFYLWRILWPAGSSAHYPMPATISPGDAAFALGMVGTVVLLPLLIVSLRWTRSAAVGWLYFFIAIFPTMGVIGFTNVIAADKFAYLPGIGLMLPAACAIAWLWDKASRPAPRVRRAAIAVATSAISLALAVGSRAYITQWDNTEKLFRYMLTLYPDAPTPRLFLGKELADQGRDAEAIDEYRRTLKLAPTFEIAHTNLGLLLVKHGKIDEGIRHHREALRLRWDFYEAQSSLGNALMKKEETAQAVKHYREAVRIRPKAADGHYNLANALVATGDVPGAVEQFELAIECNPDHAQAHKNYGIVLLQAGRRAEAVRQYAEALRLNPAWWDVANQLAWLHADSAAPALYDLPRAIRHADQACRTTGRREPVPLGTLAILLARAGRVDEARAVAGQAVDLARTRGDEALVRKIAERFQQEMDKAASRP